MREIRSSGSVEGVISNGHSYSDERVRRAQGTGACRRRAMRLAAGGWVS